MHLKSLMNRSTHNGPVAGSHDDKGKLVMEENYNSKMPNRLITTSSSVANAILQINDSRLYGGDESNCSSARKLRFV